MSSTGEEKKKKKKHLQDDTTKRKTDYGLIYLILQDCLQHRRSQKKNDIKTHGYNKTFVWRKKKK